MPQWKIKTFAQSQLSVKCHKAESRCRTVADNVTSHSDKLGLLTGTQAGCEGCHPVSPTHSPVALIGVQSVQGVNVSVPVHGRRKATLIWPIQNDEKKPEK